jgi:peptidoglycan/LPS O-acetylase OafA/YrhL
VTKGSAAVEAARFVQFDVWRGVAALGVLLFHSVNTLVFRTRTEAPRPMPSALLLSA